jgi:hypothetical protein
MRMILFRKGGPMAAKWFEVELPEEVVEWFGWQDAEVPYKVREALVMELLRRHVISRGKAAELLQFKARLPEARRVAARLLSRLSSPRKPRHALLYAAFARNRGVLGTRASAQGVFRG